MALGKKRLKALRARLDSQQKEMQSGGLIIENKTFQKMTLRLVPSLTDDELPGKKYISLYSQKVSNDNGKQGNGTTSPRTFGLDCPVMDYIDKIYQQGTKDDKQALGKLLNYSTEYWLGVWDTKDLGVAGKNSIKVLRGKRTVYQAIIDYMCDTDDDDTLEDITDIREGRNIRVRKSGTGLDTKWTTKFFDKAPVVEDEDELLAYADEASNFDVTKHFFAIDLPVLEEMYELLTGDSIPSDYLEPIKAFIGVADDDDDEDEEEEVKAKKTTKKKTTKKKKAVVVEEEEEEDEEDEEVVEDEEEEVVEEEDEGKEVEFDAEDKGIVFGETRGSFDDEGTTIEGVIIGKSKDEDGDDSYEVLEDGEDEAWGVPLEALTIIEAKKPKAKKGKKKLKSKSKMRDRFGKK